MSILSQLTVMALLCAAPVYAVAENVAGRWEGSIQIPGRDYPVIIDLDQPGGKDWAGSIIIPGLGIKGAPLIDFVVKGSEISFTIKGALQSERVGPAKFQATLNEGGVGQGSFVQAGNSAPFSVKKTGPPQVEFPRRSTAISKELEGKWKGAYEMTGYPRQFTLTLANRGSGPASAELVIVGKRTNNPAIELITEENGLLTIESPEFGITYEGRLQNGAGTIKGTFTLGPFELPLLLKRTP